MKNKWYVCIDLKSFYASVECVERGLDPFKVNLVVADPTRGNGSVCLAITPAMKALGIKNRCRVYEIPKNVKYITAMPQMRKYMKVSAEIYSVYLNYISPDDIYVYSIDECFIDVTDYCRLYKKTPREIAVMLMNAVYDKTGICSAAGIGTNMFLCKVALDITAKHAKDFIGYLDEEEFKKTIWTHQPITDIWNIGRGTAARLEKYGIVDLKGVAEFSEEQLYKEFGINAKHLIDHAHGKDRVEGVTIADVDENRRVIKGSERFIECDTLLLSVGLIPENELTRAVGIDLDPVTSGAVVDEYRETSHKGVFACGNVLHVHDLVDFVSEEAEIAGKSAAAYINGESAEKICVNLRTDGKIRYTVPQTITAAKDISVYFRVADVFRNIKINVYSGDELIFSKKKPKVAPGEMESIKLSCDKFKDSTELMFKLEEI